MIDLRVLREDPDRVRASQRARGEDDALVDRLLAADERRRAAIAAFDARRAEQKALGRTVAKASGDERATLLARAGELAQQVKDADAEQAAAEAELRMALELLPNLVDPDAPEGGEDDYVVLEHVGVPPTLEFPARDHLELGERLGAIDVERGAKVSGARFFYLTGPGALLEFALVQFALRQALAAGFVPVVPPVLVKDAAMAGTGFLGQAAADVYRLPEDELYLVGTSEVPLAAYHMDEVLDPASLPRRYVGFSTCFRREAGSYGKDTRGIIRVHQFDKVEMFAFCAPEHARDEHLRLLSEEKALLRALELPFRVIDVAAGDLGAAAARKYDCEAWLPSQARYREVTSTSNCTEFQARRLNVRTRADKGTRPVATLNGTLVAIPRTIVALLENHQRADGSVRVPAALQPILGGEVLEPAP